MSLSLGSSFWRPICRPPAGLRPSSSDTFRQLKLFGDVFERVRAEYVEEITDEQLIEAAINGMLTSPERWLQTKAASPSPPGKSATGIK